MSTEEVIEKSKKSIYYHHQFKLSDNQLKNVMDAIKSKEPIVLKLSKEHYTDGNIPLPLNKFDAKKVIDNKSFNYKLNKTKLKMLKLEQKEGSFLPLLIPLLAGLAGVGTLGTTIANSVINSKAKNAELEETNRHNKEIENIARGEAISLRPWKNGSSIDVKDFVNKSKLSDTGKKTFRSFLKNLNDKFEITYDGSAISLRNYLE